MKTAKLFQIGRDQAVELPQGFEFKGKEVFIKRVGNGILLIPKDKVHSKKQPDSATNPRVARKIWKYTGIKNT